MKLLPCPIAAFPVFMRSPLRLLLSSLVLSGTTLLTVAPAPAQTFYRPLTFEQNRRQALSPVKWLGRSSSDRAVFEGAGATFLHPDENDPRATTGRRPVPVESSRDGSSRERGSSHDSRATPKSRRPRRKLDSGEGATPAGRNLSSGPQTSSDGVGPSVPLIPAS
jgi:hypothetical protein